MSHCWNRSDFCYLSKWRWWIIDFCWWTWIESVFFFCFCFFGKISSLNWWSDFEQNISLWCFCSPVKWQCHANAFELTVITSCDSVFFLMALDLMDIKVDSKNTRKCFNYVLTCCISIAGLVLTELPLQQHFSTSVGHSAHEFHVSKAEKKRKWNPVKMTETNWKHCSLEVHSLAEFALWSLLSTSLWTYFLGLQFFKEESRSARHPKANLCCLRHFEHKIRCLPKLASHRQSLFQTKPSMWRLIFRNPIKEAFVPGSRLSRQSYDSCHEKCGTDNGLNEKSIFESTVIVVFWGSSLLN